MATEFKLTGFVELRAELLAYPQTMKRDAEPILLKYAKAGQAAVVAAYPSITGELRAGVQIVERAAHGVAAFYQLLTSAPYAHIYEFGSVHQRPRPTFLPITERDRRDAVVDVAAMVENSGLVVRGERD